MKRLEELGISPMPWDAHIGGRDDNTYALIYDANTEAFADLSNFDHEERENANAKLIAAAPELYAALEGILGTLDGLGFQPIIEGDPLAAAVKCGQRALAKASGEGME